MAHEWKVDSGRDAFYLFDPKHISVNSELNGRYELPDIEELIQSILTNGQLQPAVVRDDGGKPVLVAGYSRWRAICEINKRKLTPQPMRFKASYSRCNERDGFLLNLAENLDRKQTTPLDDAHNCSRLEKWGLSIKGIAEKLRQSENWVRQRLALMELTPEAEEALKDGRLKPTAAVAIAKLAAAQQKEALKGTGRIKGADVTKASGKSRPTLKLVREWLRESADDTTEEKIVRKYCENMLKRLDSDGAA